MQKIVKIFLVFFISLSLQAQSLLPTKYGIKLGANISNIIAEANDGVESFDASQLFGFNGGFYMEIALNDKWYINPELIYSQKGSSFTYSYVHDYEVNQRDERKSSNELKLSYIEINPTISYKTKQKISINFGPSISYLLSSEYNILSDESINLCCSGAEILEDSYYQEENLDLGLNIGLSYYLSEDFFIDGKVNTGLMSIGKISKEIYTGSDPDKLNEKIYDLQNIGIVFSIAYLF